MEDTIKETIIMISICIFCITIVFLIALFVDAEKCMQSYEKYQPQWGLMSGCRIMVDGKLTPVDIVRELK